jgi:hypothetical protein
MISGFLDVFATGVTMSLISSTMLSLGLIAPVLGVASGVLSLAASAIALSRLACS